MGSEAFRIMTAQLLFFNGYPLEENLPDYPINYRDMHHLATSQFNFPGFKCYRKIGNHKDSKIVEIIRLGI